MIAADKPPLAEVYLAHFGVKGMKWGVRKTRPDEAQRKARFSPEGKAKAKKIALATAGVIGAAAVGYALHKSGGVKVSPGGLTDPKSPLYNAMTAGKKSATVTFQKPVKLSDMPSPQTMMAQARMAGVRTQVMREGNQRLTDASWRASAGLASEARKMGGSAARSAPSIDEIRRRLNDPSYVWNL